MRHARGQVKRACTDSCKKLSSTRGDSGCGYASMNEKGERERERKSETKE